MDRELLFKFILYVAWFLSLLALPLLVIALIWGDDNCTVEKYLLTDFLIFIFLTLFIPQNDI